MSFINRWKGWFCPKQYEPIVTSKEITEEDIAKEALVTVINTIIHDFSNPLSYAIGAAQFLQDSVDDNTYDENVVEAISDTNHGLMNTNGFLSELKDIVGGKALKRQDVKIVKLFSSIGTFLPKNDCVIKYDAEDTSILRTSHFALFIVLQNLVKNVFEHAPGCVVTLSHNDGVITVEDNGPGIPKDKLNKIFSSYSSKVGQTGGLGLQIVDSFVKRLNGSIVATSEVGKGTCFTLKFAN